MRHSESTIDLNQPITCPPTHPEPQLELVHIRLSHIPSPGRGGLCSLASSTGTHYQDLASLALNWGANITYSRFRINYTYQLVECFLQVSLLGEYTLRLMVLSAKALRAFASATRRALQAAETPRRGGLLSGASVRRQAVSYQQTRPLATQTSPQQTETSPIEVSASHILPGEYAGSRDAPAHGVLAHGSGYASRKSKPLPTTCPGCGALSQEVDSEEAGYYTRSRKAVRHYLKHIGTSLYQDKNQGVATPVPTTHDENVVSTEDDGTMEGGLSADVELSPSQSSLASVPVCDRCHDLIYNSRGKSIAHPSVEALADSIAESPFSRNHVYHVLDAADFPMSLIPSIYSTFDLAKPRSQNRRSQHSFSRKPTISFIITRSDLLGPTKEMVDTMMPYFQSVLRSALGKFAKDMRLGNVHLVSAKRGWWTTDIKEAIWTRGGGNWMLGKVNVGKSNLFEVLFPKGSGDRAPVYTELAQAQGQDPANAQPTPDFKDNYLPEDSLLPPAQPETPFPALPVVSSMPGTTASPIRLPFGNHRGELIDLPGLERGNLEEFVAPDHKLDLVMSHRPNVEQSNVRPGQSLLLGGGLVRITPSLDPNDPSMTMQAYAFVPIDVHVTSTEKAIATQFQQRESGVKSILADGAGHYISSAGTFSLTSDVTKARAGSLVRAGVDVSKMPFRVFSTDILVEGVGWIELVCQVRKRRQTAHTEPHPSCEDAASPTSSAIRPAVISDLGNTFNPFSSPSSVQTSFPGQMDDASFSFPQVEIFTPHGKHVSQRKPLGAWLLWDSGRKRRQRAAAAARPRRPMKGAKKLEKMARRAAEAAA